LPWNLVLDRSGSKVDVDYCQYALFDENAVSAVSIRRFTVKSIVF